MEIVFTVRMSKEIYEKLAYLAKKTHRSKANVIRWLVYESVPDHERMVKDDEHKSTKS